MQKEKVRNLENSPKICYNSIKSIKENQIHVDIYITNMIYLYVIQRKKRLESCTMMKL